MRIYGGKTMRVKDIIRFVNEGKFSFSDYVHVVHSDGRCYDMAAKTMCFCAPCQVMAMHTTSNNIIDEAELA